MSKNLKIKKIKEGNFKTLIITNNDKNKKFSLRNVKTIFNTFSVGTLVHANGRPGDPLGFPDFLFRHLAPSSDGCAVS